MTYTNNGLIEELEKAAQPVVDFLREHGDPHQTVIIEQDSIRLVSDKIGIPVPIQD